MELFQILISQIELSLNIFSPKLPSQIIPLTYDLAMNLLLFLQLAHLVHYILLQVGLLSFCLSYSPQTLHFFLKF